MRNVYKGFQTSHMAVPKVHMASINQAFNTHHTPSARPLRMKFEKPQVPKNAKRPGRNPGIGRGGEVL